MHPILPSGGTYLSFVKIISMFVPCVLTEPKFARGMMLREHLRCYDEIIAYCDELVYQNTLRPQRGPRDLNNPLPAFGYSHISAQTTQKGGSKENEEEARVIAAWIKNRKDELEIYYGQGGKKAKIEELVAVVTPYAAQSSMIQSKLREQKLSVSSKSGEPGITVGTLHRLQGAERRIILFSPAVGFKDASKSTFFGRDPEMLNVAVSRAQDSFIVFGNMGLFNSNSPDHPSRLLGQYLLKPENEITDVTPALRDIKVRAHETLISDLDKHVAFLKHAFKKVEKRIVIVSPFLTLAAMNSDGIDQVIKETVSKGDQVDIFTDRQLNKQKIDEFHRTMSLDFKGSAPI